jgi:DHA2 family multidrug resistance protein
MCLGISLYGSVLLLPQFVENSLGFTATLSGELLIMRAAFVLVCTPFVARFAGQGIVDPRIFVASGFIMVGLSNVLLARVTTSDSSFWTFLIPLALSGIGLSQLFVPLTISTIGSVSPAEIPAASAFFNLARQIGGSIAIAVLVTVLARQGDVHRTALASSITRDRAPIAQSIQRQGSVAAAARQLDQLVGAQSQVLAYADTAADTALITLVLTPLVFLMRRSQQRRAPVLAD